MENEIAFDSPIETLPNDVLELIFLEVARMRESRGTSSHPTPALDMKFFPWASGQVCSRWRRLALSHPRMWNNIYVEMHDWPSQKETMVLCANSRETPLSQLSVAEIMKERLVRCRSSPITITIRADLNREENIEVAKMLAVLGAHSEQWKSVSLDISNEALAKSLFCQVNGQLPCLEKLQWDSLCAILWYNCDVVAPRLSNLTMSGSSSIGSLPWSQLTEVSFFSGAHPTLENLRTLQRSDKLTKLKFQWASIKPPYQSELRFNNLRVLSCCLPVLHAFLELPALEVLHLKIDRNFCHFSTMLAFIQRCSPSLKSLALPPIFRDESTVIEILNMLPDLHTLSINAVDSNKYRGVLTVVDHLMVHPGRLEATLLPNLQHLRIQDLETSPALPRSAVKETKAMMEKFIKLVESRFSTDSGLPRLKSVEWVDIDEELEVHKHLFTMMKRGLTVKSTSRWP
ncbi:hypothetical protein C8J56DRAFT_892454 [Mycena floridula]|nr:hypothetical protein C8J56DRAFT_892454 [Mycena floridula]